MQPCLLLRLGEAQGADRDINGTILGQSTRCHKRPTCLLQWLIQLAKGGEDVIIEGVCNVLNKVREGTLVGECSLRCEAEHGNHRQPARQSSMTCSASASWVGIAREACWQCILSTCHPHSNAQWASDGRQPVDLPTINLYPVTHHLKRRQMAHQPHLRCIMQCCTSRQMLPASDMLPNCDRQISNG